MHEHKSNFDYGKKFVEMIKNHQQYRGLIRVKTTYEVKLVHREGRHWYLLVKPKDSELPYVSLEVRTTDLYDLVQYTCDIDFPKMDVYSDVGFYEGTLLNLCELAVSVVKEMDSYELLSANCQTFCNSLLKKMGKPEFSTSTELIDREIELIGEALVGHSSNGVTNCIPMTDSGLT